MKLVMLPVACDTVSTLFYHLSICYFSPFVNSLSYRFRYILKAATSPTRRLEEDSLTYLNQGT